MNIREAHEKFGTDEQCLTYIEKMRWPDGVVRCPLCGCKEITKVERKSTSKNKRGWFYLCLEKTCHNQFSATSGTIFHDTHLPLIVWFQAIVLMLNAKKSLSAKQLQRDLGIGGYKTAWYLAHRIRKAMEDGEIPMLGGIVEIDETYIGGKSKIRDRYKNKHAVIGLRERGGKLRFVHTATNPMQWQVYNIIENNVDKDVELIVTDDSKLYNFDKTQFSGKHKSINHSKGKYVRRSGKDLIHTNTIENAFSLLKRGIIGSFHKVSIKHLGRYLAEFEYRFNRRKEDAFAETLSRLAGFTKPLTFDALTSEKA